MNSTPPMFCSAQTLDRLHAVHPHWKRHLLPQSTNSNAYLLQKWPHGHTRKNASPAVWASWAQSSGHMNLTITDPKELEAGTHSISAPMFIAALLTIAKRWRPPKCPVTREGQTKCDPCNRVLFSPTKAGALTCCNVAEP